MTRTGETIGGCGDAFHLDIALADDWRFYKMSFGELHQAGYGYAPPDGFDKKTIFSVVFTNLQGTEFDEWIDDIAFYK